MRSPIRLVTILCFFFTASQGQIINTATMDTLETTTIGHLAVGGYMDTYFGYNFNKPSSGTIPYFVSSNRHDEMNINLAYIDLRYKSTNFRARFVPGYGTYMNANYANEIGTLKNIVEATAGLRLSAKRNIWVDVGVFTSPYTNESPFSKDHLMYTRSFAPENVPYYLSGLKVSLPLSKKVNSFLYLLNGWQVIQDNNRNKSIGTQLEYRPNKKMLFNWDTYMGNNQNQANPNWRMRYFTDLYWIYKYSDRFDATACVYIGFQERLGAGTLNWWQANMVGRYHFNDMLSLSGRIEYFSDDGIHLQSITGIGNFNSYSTGLCFNYKANHNALLRVEGRHFFSPDQVYFNENQNPTQNSTWFITSLTAWF